MTSTPSVPQVAVVFAPSRSTAQVQQDILLRLEPLGFATHSVIWDPKVGRLEYLDAVRSRAKSGSFHESAAAESLAFILTAGTGEAFEQLLRTDFDVRVVVVLDDIVKLESHGMDLGPRHLVVQGHMAERETALTHEDYRCSERHLEQGGIEVEFYYYPGTTQGFYVVPDSRSYDPVAARQMWERVETVLVEALIEP